MKPDYSFIQANILSLLLTVFIVLKLTDKIDWSWWWVLSPIWIPIVAVISILLIIILILKLHELF